MKWAAAKMKLSFVTETLNSLRVPTPASFEQHRVDRRPAQVGGGAGIQGVGLVAQLAVERGDFFAPGRGADAAGGEHGAPPLPRGDGGPEPERAGDGRVARVREGR